MVVMIWTACGFLFHLGVAAYQLIGVAIVTVFQRFVRREPLRALWLRDAPAFRLDAAGWSIAVLLAICPLTHIVVDMRSAGPVTKTVVHVAAIASCLPAAYALRNLGRTTLRLLLLCLAIPGGIGIVMMAAGAMAGNLAHRTLLERLTIGIDSFLLYLPLVFVFEEVSFRGAFDAHIQHPGESGGWLTAVWISVLWGLWHVPVTLTMAPLPALILNNILVCCVIGVPFSILWRRSGNLCVTGVTHAVIDAVRNALIILPF